MWRVVEGKTNVKAFARCGSWRDSITKGQSTQSTQQPEWQSQVTECQLEGELCMHELAWAQRPNKGLKFYCDSDLWGNLIEPHHTEISFRWHSQDNSTSVPSWELTGKLPNHNTTKRRFQYLRVSFAFFSFYWLLFICFQNLLRMSVPFLCESTSSCLKICGMTMTIIRTSSTIIPVNQKAYVDDTFNQIAPTRLL